MLANGLGGIDQGLSYADVVLDAYVSKPEEQFYKDLAEVLSEVAQLRASRVAYASELGCDIGDIHEAIRKQKSEIKLIRTAVSEMYNK